MEKCGNCGKQKHKIYTGVVFGGFHTREDKIFFGGTKQIDRYSFEKTPHTCFVCNECISKLIEKNQLLEIVAIPVCIMLLIIPILLLRVLLCIFIITLIGSIWESKWLNNRDNSKYDMGACADDIAIKVIKQRLPKDVLEQENYRLFTRQEVETIKNETYIDFER